MNTHHTYTQQAQKQMKESSQNTSHHHHRVSSSYSCSNCSIKINGDNSNLSNELTLLKQYIVCLQSENKAKNVQRQTLYSQLQALTNDNTLLFNQVDELKNMFNQAQARLNQQQQLLFMPIININGIQKQSQHLSCLQASDVQNRIQGTIIMCPNIHDQDQGVDGNTQMIMTKQKTELFQIQQSQYKQQILRCQDQIKQLNQLVSGLRMQNTSVTLELASITSMHEQLLGKYQKLEHQYTLLQSQPRYNTNQKQNQQQSQEYKHGHQARCSIQHPTHEMVSQDEERSNEQQSSITMNQQSQYQQQQYQSNHGQHVDICDRQYHDQTLKQYLSGNHNNRQDLISEQAQLQIQCDGQSQAELQPQPQDYDSFQPSQQLNEQSLRINQLIANYQKVQEHARLVQIQNYNLKQQNYCLTLQLQQTNQKISELHKQLSELKNKISIKQKKLDNKKKMGLDQLSNLIKTKQNQRLAYYQPTPPTEKLDKMAIQRLITNLKLNQKILPYSEDEYGYQLKQQQEYPQYQFQDHQSQGINQINLIKQNNRLIERITALQRQKNTLYLQLLDSAHRTSQLQHQGQGFYQHQHIDHHHERGQPFTQNYLPMGNNCNQKRNSYPYYQLQEKKINDNFRHSIINNRSTITNINKNKSPFKLSTNRSACSHSHSKNNPYRTLKQCSNKKEPEVKMLYHEQRLKNSQREQHNNNIREKIQQLKSQNQIILQSLKI